MEISWFTAITWIGRIAFNVFSVSGDEVTCRLSSADGGKTSTRGGTIGRHNSVECQRAV